MGAARRKGKYIGGRPILGYNVDRETKRLVVNESEAVRVRQIFDLYLEHEGLIPTVDAIQQQGFRTKLWITKAGRKIGGNRINAGDRLHKTSAGVLAGLIHCSACNCLMTHSSSGGASKPR